MSILTVTLNATVDKIYTVPGFALGQVHRPDAVRVYAGGKGINVARVSRTMGCDVLATGWLGGTAGDFLARSLAEEGIPADFVPIAGESRECIQIIDPQNATQTEVNEIGPRVSESDCSHLLIRIRALLPGCSVIVLSGSMPPGASPTLYYDIITLAQDEFRVKAVLDTSGAALAEGIKAHPFLAKPNQHEVAGLGIIGEWEEAALAMRLQYHLPFAIVTAGARGAVMASEAGLWRASPPPIPALSAIGSGDALTAAFIWAWQQGIEMSEALRWGVAAGAANALSYGSGFCTRGQIQDMFWGTQVNKIG